MKSPKIEVPGQFQCQARPILKQNNRGGGGGGLTSLSNGLNGWYQIEPPDEVKKNSIFCKI